MDENSYLEESCRSCIKMNQREKEKEVGEVLERDAERKEGEEVDGGIEDEEKWGGEEAVEERFGKGEFPMKSFTFVRYVDVTHLCLLQMF